MRSVTVPRLHVRVVDEAINLRKAAGSGPTVHGAMRPTSDYLFEKISPALRVAALARPLRHTGG